MDARRVLAERREEIASIAARHGARNIRVFGSAARGEAGVESDIDLLVELEPGRSLFDHIALWQEIEALLGCRVDVISERGLSPYLRERILAEARPL
jgi:predicted nucleotidyltransferase